VLVQSSLHPPSFVVPHVLSAADLFAEVLVDMPESAVKETALAFASTLREPDPSVYVKSENISEEVIPFCIARKKL
jgi:hypothetical protein